VRRFRPYAGEDKGNVELIDLSKIVEHMADILKEFGAKTFHFEDRSAAEIASYMGKPDAHPANCNEPDN